MGARVNDALTYSLTLSFLSPRISYIFAPGLFHFPISTLCLFCQHVANKTRAHTSPKRKEELVLLTALISIPSIDEQKSQYYTQKQKTPSKTNKSRHVSDERAVSTVVVVERAAVGKGAMEIHTSPSLFRDICILRQT